MSLRVGKKSWKVIWCCADCSIRVSHVCDTSIGTSDALSFSTSSNIRSSSCYYIHGDSQVQMYVVHSLHCNIVPPKKYYKRYSTFAYWIDAEMLTFFTMTTTQWTLYNTQ